MKKNVYFKWGLTAFLVICATILFWLLMFEYNRILGIFGKVFLILRPVVIGLVLAYILNPLMKLYSRLFGKLKANAARMISVAMAVITGIAIVTLLINLVIPQVVESVVSIVRDMPAQLTRAAAYLNKTIEGDSMTAEALRNAVEYVRQNLPSFAQDKVMPIVNDLANTIVLSATGVITVFKDIIIGLIIAIYLLAGKEKFLKQIKFVLKTLLRRKKYGVVMEIASKANEVFYGFITGMILDSTIIGCICCVVMIILNVPYAVLVSVIVGCTNIIPVFGPFIGGIPCAIIILMESPIKALYFVIAIIVMQQIDGNIISPRILGNSTGLSAFWVMFAILVFGGIFGFVGMIIGVPTMSVIYYIVDKWIRNRAKKKAREELRSSRLLVNDSDEG